MLAGKLYPQTSPKWDGWEKLYEHTISASDTEAKLLAMFDGVDGATTGMAETGQTLTFVGTAQLDTAQKKIGVSCLLLDGNSDYVTLLDSDDWYFGTGNFTIDCWIRFNTLPVIGVTEVAICGQVADANNYWRILINSARKFEFNFNSGGVLKANYSSQSALPGLAVDTWYHIAIERYGTGAKAFLNGTEITLTESTAFGANDVGNISASLTIGALEVVNAAYFDGWIDALRITKGTTLWTSNFTPPTTINDYVGTSAISIFGLAGDTDEIYMLDVRGIDDTTVGNWLLRLNADGGANYGYQNLSGIDNVIAAARSSGTSFILMATATDDDVCQTNVLIYAKSGKVRTLLNQNAGSIAGKTVTNIYEIGQVWNNLADEITSMVISATADNMEIGTHVSLYRKISA